jgi:hypothetical protein
LPAALDVPAATVTEAIAETTQQQREAEDAAWRAAFKPHAVVLTEHRIPTQITFAAITGADAHLIVNFEPGSTPITYLRQALKAVKLRSPVRFYGRAIGVVVNYGPDTAVRFDLDGTPQELLTTAYLPGQLTVSIRGRPVSRDALAAILGS